MEHYNKLTLRYISFHILLNPPLSTSPALVGSFAHCLVTLKPLPGSPTDFFAAHSYGNSTLQQWVNHGQTGQRSIRILVTGVENHMFHEIS